ncbi:hypothetical protein BGZ57DRAFT_756567 [Hyaloscypha finlandica]|nr:hypothetical protein BGZ57DRAFT_756567 [Hyaloscypha finlandica]
MAPETEPPQNRRPLILILFLFPLAFLLGIALSNNKAASPDLPIPPPEKPQHTPPKHQNTLSDYDPYRETYHDSDTQPFQTERLSLSTLGGSNTVICWPSIGGLIIADRVTPVELTFLNLPRFTSTPRSLNQTAEDIFCRQLRKIGGKWFSSHWDWWAKYVQMSKGMKPEEMEVLTLGWPETGGVWVLRRQRSGHSLRVRNAVSMEERCEVIEMSGGVFYKRPEENMYVKALLEGFGEKGRFDDDWAVPPLGLEDQKRMKGQKG